MSTQKIKKRKVDETWVSVSNSMHKNSSEDYHIEIEWLKQNICRITTTLYGNHNQPIPACHQTAHYIYLGVSIFKMLRGNAKYISKRVDSQKRIFEKLMMDAIYENQRYLFLLADNDFQKSHRWLYVCPEELTRDSQSDGNYLVLCITSGHLHNKDADNCLIQKMKGWMRDGIYPSEINAGHYGFLSLYDGKVDMTSSWVSVSTTESARYVEYDTFIGRQVNSHVTTLEMFQEYARIIAMPLQQRNELKDQSIVDHAYDFIGAISRYDPLLKSYVTRALLKRDQSVFAEYMNPLIVILIKIEDLPIGFKHSTGEDYTLEDRLELPTPASLHDHAHDFEFVDDTDKLEFPLQGHIHDSKTDK